jgi:hypothetical protein
MKVTAILGALSGLLISQPVFNSAVLAQSTTQPANTQTTDTEWIDPDILKQLQNIQPIDRSKLTPEAMTAIAKRLTGFIEAPVMTTQSSKVGIPELNMPEDTVVLVKGKTKKASITPGGHKYPAGTPIEFTFGSGGNLIKSVMTFPKGVHQPSRLLER